ncbi:ABC transporter [Mesorhizobium sp. L-8-10]|nr:ABC transporter [Mesorhizobium sp. L-8-10]
MTGEPGVDIGVLTPQTRIIERIQQGPAAKGVAGRRVKQPTALVSSVFVLAMLLPGCALLPGGGPAPLDTYELTSPSAEAHHAKRRTQVLIAEPSALKAIDGQNIVIRSGPGVIQYLKGAQWADRLPKIVQARLAESVQRSGAFAGVGRPGEGLAIDFQVLVEIREFEIRLGGGDTATVELFVKILNDRNGVVRAARTFKASSPVSGTGNDAYIAALDRAFGKAASEIVSWSVTVM